MKESFPSPPAGFWDGAVEDGERPKEAGESSVKSLEKIPLGSLGLKAAAEGAGEGSAAAEGAGPLGVGEACPACPPAPCAEREPACGKPACPELVEGVEPAPKQATGKSKRNTSCLFMVTPVNHR